jgi:hypothetical protein
VNANSKGYVAGGEPFLYPGAGDPSPPGGAKVLLLTKGGICTTGQWTPDGRFMGWLPMPKRDMEKEARL